MEDGSKHIVFLYSLELETKPRISFQYIVINVAISKSSKLKKDKRKTFPHLSQIPSPLSPFLQLNTRKPLATKKTLRERGCHTGLHLFIVQSRAVRGLAESSSLGKIALTITRAHRALGPMPGKPGQQGKPGEK